MQVFFIKRLRFVGSGPSFRLDYSPLYGKGALKKQDMSSEWGKSS